VILTRIEDAMTPKKRHWETGAEVKPEASMVDCQGGCLNVNLAAIMAEVFSDDFAGYFT